MNGESWFDKSMSELDSPQPQAWKAQMREASTPEEITAIAMSVLKNTDAEETDDQVENTINQIATHGGEKWKKTYVETYAHLRQQIDATLESEIPEVERTSLTRVREVLNDPKFD